jgi:hypothetical protein
VTNNEGIVYNNCREAPANKSNQAIAEDVTRLARYWAPRPDAARPDEACINHAKPVGGHRDASTDLAAAIRIDAEIATKYAKCGAPGSRTQFLGAMPPRPSTAPFCSPLQWIATAAARPMQDSGNEIERRAGAPCRHNRGEPPCSNLKLEPPTLLSTTTAQTTTTTTTATHARCARKVSIEIGAQTSQKRARHNGPSVDLVLFDKIYRDLGVNLQKMPVRPPVGALNTARRHSPLLTDEKSPFPCLN